MKLLKDKEGRILLVLLTWLLINLLFYKNDRYTIDTGDKTYLTNVNERVYDDFIGHTGESGYFIQHTSIKYFGIFPDWSMNIIYIGYYVIGAWYLSYKIDR